MIMYGQISCICLHANEGRESKTKDSVYNAHLNFRSFFGGKKVFTAPMMKKLVGEGEGLIMPFPAIDFSIFNIGHLR